MSSMTPFYNTVTSDPVQTAESYNFQRELNDLLMRYQRYLSTANAVPLQALKQLQGGTVAVTQPGNGVVVLTMTPTGPVPNPNPNAT